MFSCIIFILELFFNAVHNPVFWDHDPQFSFCKKRIRNSILCLCCAPSVSHICVGTAKVWKSPGAYVHLRALVPFFSPSRAPFLSHIDSTNSQTPSKAELQRESPFYNGVILLETQSKKKKVFGSNQSHKYKTPARGRTEKTSPKLLWWGGAGNGKEKSMPISAQNA